MNKKCMSKMGAISSITILVLVMTALLLIVFASATQTQYQLGEKVKIEIGDIGKYSLEIQTPNQTLLYKSENPYFIFQPSLPGEYKITINSKSTSKEITFIVVSTSNENPEQTSAEATSPEVSKFQEDQITINIPVKHKQTIQPGENIKLKIPESSTNITISEEAEFKVKNSLLDKVSNLLTDEDQKSLIIQNANQELELQYITPAPESQEKNISRFRKEVIISSEIHYENVLAYTQIEEFLSLDQQDTIKIFWKEENTYLNFQALDTNENGLIDKIQWIAPHLSTQTFDIILATEAQHLDTSRNPISDIFEKIKDLDNFWTKNINENEYVRVKFETPLDNKRDITIFPRIISGNPKVEVYEANNETKIAEFSEIIPYQYNKVYLTNLERFQDTFDLKIINGQIQFNHIIDPQETLYVNSFDSTYVAWDTESGPSPHLGDNDDYIDEGGTNNVLEGIFGFENTSIGTGTINNVTAYFECNADDGPADDGFNVFMDNGTGFTEVGTILPDASYGWKSLDVSSKIGSWAAVDSVEFYVQYNKDSGGDNVRIRRAYISVDYTISASGPISVLLNTPETDTFSNSRSITFNYTPSSDNPFTNCSLWDNSTGPFSYNQSNSTSITNGTANYITKTYDSDGNFLWNIQCCDDVSGCAFAALNRTINIDTVDPYVELIAPVPDSNETSNMGIDFQFNVTDEKGIQNCSLIVGGEIKVTDDTITNATTQTINYFLEDGIHSWHINCSDLAGNEYQSSSRNVNVSVQGTDWQKRFYETGTSNYTSTANIYLANSRDSTENEAAVQIPATSLATIVDAYSPYMGGSGAFISAGDILFSGVFSTTRQNQEYITWKVYISNSTGDYLVCQSGDDSTGGVKLGTTNKATYAPASPCNNPSNLSLQGTDRIRLIVNAYNAHTAQQNVTNYWDDLDLSYVEFADFYSLGQMDVDLTYPTTDQNIVTSEQLNVSCNTTCIGGRCENTNVYVQYNTSATGWTNLNGTSGNLILSSGETNPHDLGSTNSTSQVTNFTIEGNAASINNIRCIAISDYSSKNGTTTKKVTVLAADQPPSVNLTSPEDNWWFNYSNINLFYNASDDNNQIANCSLFINGQFNQTNQTPVTQENNFTLSGLANAQYNWSVNCTDQSSLSYGTTNRTFYVDTGFPQPSLVYPADNDTIYQSIINFNFSVTDNMDSTLTCNLTVNGSILEPNFNAVSGEYTNITKTLSMGEYLWNITCIDEAGNLNTSETNNFTIMDLAPVVNLSTQDNNWFTTLNPVLEYNASDNNNIVNCSLFINGQYNQSNSTTINESEINNFTLSGLNEGLYNWTVNCTDDAGTSVKPAERNFYVDITAPTLNLNLPGNESTILTSDVNFNFTATENLGNINCNLTVNGQVDNPGFASNNGSLTNELVSGLTDGVKYWNVTCWDSAGLTNQTSTRWINVTEYPSVEQNTQDNEAFNETTINLYYTPSDNTGFESCSLYINGQFNQTNQTSISDGVQNNFTLTAGSGYYNWSVSCTDSFGLTSQTQNRSFMVDLAKPSIFLNYPAIEDSIYDATVTFNYTADDDLDNNIECNLTVNGVVENITEALDEQDTLIPVTFASGGLKIWNVTCIDDAGNSNISETRNFTLYLPPTVTLASPEPFEWFNYSTLDFFYDVSDGNDDIANATLIINNLANQTNQTPVINDDENNFTGITFTEGQYNWTVNVTDTEGSTGTDNQRTFWIDTTKPSVETFYPSQDAVVDTNNITFNFSVLDNMDSEIMCNLTIGIPGDPPEAGHTNFNVSNETTQRYVLKIDANYSWFLDCVDEAGNRNITEVINFSVVAPPFVELNNPPQNDYTNQSAQNFNYTPYDAYGLTKCDLYIDGAFNDTDADIEKNEPNFFNGVTLSEGQHNWTVECTDSDSNVYMPANRTIYIDQTPPTITLNAPGNETGVDANNANIIFNWTPTDALDSTLTCDLVVDGNVEDSDFATSGFPRVEPVSGLSIGWHYWNITCSDQSGNSYTSETLQFNYTYPDFYTNESLIIISNSNPTENESIQINATIYNLGGVNISSVDIKFYNGDPEDSGVQIGSTQTISITKFSSNTTSINWNAPLGTSNIYVIADFPDSITELNETNNKANSTISVESWHFFYGNINSDTNLTLSDSSLYEVVNWNLQNLTNANIYVADSDSNVNWLSLQAIGKTNSGGDSNNDIQEIDSALSMTGYQDSHSNLYLNGSEMNETLNYTVFAVEVIDVPVSSSINSTNFKTGILWDTSDGTDSEYNSTEKEDIVYITSIEKSTMGSYEVVDYELRVPASLRSYDATDEKSASFYLEII